MHRINVRCCCQPQKILGTLDLPTLDRQQTICEKIILPSINTAAVVTGWLVKDTVIKKHDIKLREFRSGFDFEIAVYSEDRPIEFWSKLVGFIEAKDER